MIKVEKLSYSFQKKDLYNEISFTLEEGQHCAFIGASGCGKTTLVDIIMDPEKYMFKGNLEIDPDYRLGYVSQFYRSDKSEDLTVFEYIGKESIKLQNELMKIYDEMETSSNIEALMERHEQVLDAFNALGGDDFESKINKKLNLANLMDLKDLKVYEISGGEFKLIQVVKEMLNNPDLIIMDEPDVFLDFENLNSLKNLINSHRGTLLVISHNRYLLNHCFNKIIHLENMAIQEFEGTYTNYNLSLLQSKIELQELAHIDSEEIKRNELLIEKFRGAAEENADSSIGQHVNSRVKIQERLEARRIKAPFVYIKEPIIKFNSYPQLDDITALKLTNYNFSFDDVLLENINFEIKANDKVVIIGENGSGKTTLLRELFKNKDDSIEFNKDIRLAYLSQVLEEILNDSNTVAEEFFDAGFESYDEIRSCIQDHGLDKEILNQKITCLSGGEKNLLQLAKISNLKANMLLLDEPTSHLDSYSQIALEKALKNYKGAILMISHDFYSIVNSMDYVLIIEDKTIRKMSMRKFRKMIYTSHFDMDYLQIAENKSSLERKIELALKENNFPLAKIFSEELESIIKSFKL